MATQPSTKIYISHSIPLDRDYKHTIYFPNAATQHAYFVGRNVVKTLSSNSYQRINKNTIRVEVKADEIYNCNYMFFQNEAHTLESDPRWFYCFITNIEYVNENTSEITYEIDVMQTYFFHYKGNSQSVFIGPSYVEREHSVTDNVGDNLVEEKLDVGEYIADDMGTSNHLTNLSVVAIPYVTYTDSSGQPHIKYTDDKPDVYGLIATGGLHSGLNYVAFPVSNQPPYQILHLSTFLEEIRDKGLEKDVVSIFYQPRDFVTNTGSPIEYQISLSKRNNTTNNPFGSFAPKNNKLFTYPYNMLYVTNNQGVNAVYPFEYFSHPVTPSNCEFIMNGTYSPSAQFMIYPAYYKGITNNLDEKVVLDGYPSVAFNIDEYRDYLANNKTSIALDLVSNTIRTLSSTALMFASPTVGGMMMGMGGAASGLSNVEHTLAQIKDRRVSPAHTSGSASNSVMLSGRYLDYHFYNKHIRTEFARIIDDYFSLYGYATHRLKVPNISSRPAWNYVKTVGANIGGEAPASVIEKIESIFNNGITFWKVTATGDVGDYNRNNKPTS